MRRKKYASSKYTHSMLILISEICLGVITVLGSLLIFTKLADKVLEKETILFDNIITYVIYLFRNPQITSIMTSITYFGDEIFLGSAIIITILLLWIKKHKRDALIFSFILFFGIMLNLLLKDLFQRPRPQLFPLTYEYSYSFPSGHSMNSFVFYMSLSYFIFRNTGNKKLGIFLTFLSGILIFSIGVSRIYLGVHYPSDVIAGFAAGLLWFCLVLLFEKTLIFLRLLNHHESHKKLL